MTIHFFFVIERAKPWLPLHARAETNLGGTLQLLVDLQFVAGAFAPLINPGHEATLAASRELVVAQALGMAGDEPDQAAALERWLRGVEVRPAPRNPNTPGPLRLRAALPAMGNREVQRSYTFKAQRCCWA